VILSGFGLERAPEHVRHRIASLPDGPRKDSIAERAHRRGGVLPTGRLAVPEEIAARLTSCDEVGRDVARSLREADPARDPTALPVPGLLFVDSDRDGSVEETAAGVHVVHLPTHDPWFTHRAEYFERVESFLSELGP